ncbi:hypothetical protein SMACR_04760 [Sordaria macrospora]|uniref:WGS project CABT00000000 data, contig 2.21 n=2 Tax=Sordaria macrospora TaxID=5147 RepID=F7W2C8_SORMK|nr:uncharacterized protein SMAC_04760 [Sordaria macrospora k-hell]KAA8636723.1 hypothetical protein SMACR_04760 [Sordaria macrospora]WPJ62035.1 hypothetical protein SMAC4_04760 [Sordaria macrospora]CCC11778.1 unnamed protein product [Sordaria macrospora k-hell]
MTRRSARLNPTDSSSPSQSTTTYSSASTPSVTLATSTSTEQQPKPAVKRRGRPPAAAKQMESAQRVQADEDERRPLLDGGHAQASIAATAEPMGKTTWASRNHWIVLAMASGACAAFNGAFAKLTTTELTSTFSDAIARLLHLTEEEKMIEVIVRGIFFGLNLVFNGVMWTLFTQALARGHSTTQVSIMNTSSNFVITAMLGFVIFSEALPPMWWVGAAMLVVGNVIIGRKDESEGTKDTKQDGDDGHGTGSRSGNGATKSVGASAEGLAEDGLGTYRRVPVQAEGSGSRGRQDDGILVHDDVEKEDSDEGVVGR